MVFGLTPGDVVSTIGEVCDRESLSSDDKKSGLDNSPIGHAELRMMAIY